MTKLMKFGYEGEGPMIGRRTVYASYPEVAVQQVVDEANSRDVDSIYFVIESNHHDFVESLFLVDLKAVKVVTIDYPAKNHSAYRAMSFLIRFIRCDLTTTADDVPVFRDSPHTYIKMVCEDSAVFGDFVDKANEIARYGHTVLLMPDFLTSRPLDLGFCMMEVFDRLHPSVRVCPPVHHVLGTP